MFNCLLGILLRLVTLETIHFWEVIYLGICLCVPTFKFNLLFVSKVTKDLNCCAKLYPEHCVFQDLCTGKVKATDRVQDDLYILNTQHTGNTLYEKKCIAVHDPNDPEIWHKRLGHVPMLVLRRILIFNNLNAFHL